MFAMVSVLLFLVGLAGVVLGSAMFGDIGLAAMIGGFAAFLSGIGIYRLSKRVAALESSKGDSQ